MSAEMKDYVLNLLDTYQDRERKIAVLRYELAHPAMVSDTEQIEMMAYGRGDGQGHTKGRVSNKTLYIALNYEEQTERMNAEAASEIANELFALEQCQKKLVHYIDLLEKRQAEVIKLVFFEQVPTKDIAVQYSLTQRTIDRIKKTAVECLVEMYTYSERFKG